VYTIRSFTALAQKVLIVAVSDDHNWTAYIDAVPGERHTREAEDVARAGNKLPQKLAEFLFPEMAKVYIWRE